MNWDAVAAVSELVGTIAVVASLIYLGIQVKQANRNSHEQTRQRMMELGQDQLFQLVQQPEIFSAFSEEDVSTDDLIKFNHWLVAAMRAREYEWFAYKNGMIDEKMFNSYSGIIFFLLGTERARMWWDSHKSINEFDQEFCKFVDGLLENAPLVDMLQRIKKFKNLGSKSTGSE